MDIRIDNKPYTLYRELYNVVTGELLMLVADHRDNTLTFLAPSNRMHEIEIGGETFFTKGISNYEVLRLRSTIITARALSNLE